MGLKKRAHICSVADTVANKHLVTKEGIDTEGHNLYHIRGQREKDATDKLSSTENRGNPQISLVCVLIFSFSPSPFNKLHDPTGRGCMI